MCTISVLFASFLFCFQVLQWISTIRPSITLNEDSDRRLLSVTWIRMYYFYSFLKWICIQESRVCPGKLASLNHSCQSSKGTFYASVQKYDKCSISRCCARRTLWWFRNFLLAVVWDAETTWNPASADPITKGAGRRCPTCSTMLGRITRGVSGRIGVGSTSRYWWRCHHYYHAKILRRHWTKFCFPRKPRRCWVQMELPQRLENCVRFVLKTTFGCIFMYLHVCNGYGGKVKIQSRYSQDTGKWIQICMCVFRWERTRIHAEFIISYQILSRYCQDYICMCMCLYLP